MDIFHLCAYWKGSATRVVVSILETRALRSQFYFTGQGIPDAQWTVPQRILITVSLQEFVLGACDLHIVTAGVHN
jgi:hypothetical protein